MISQVQANNYEKYACVILSLIHFYTNCKDLVSTCRPFKIRRWTAWTNRSKLVNVSCKRTFVNNWHIAVSCIAPLGSFEYIASFYHMDHAMLDSSVVLV